MLPLILMGTAAHAAPAKIVCVPGATMLKSHDDRWRYTTQKGKKCWHFVKGAPHATPQGAPAGPKVAPNGGPTLGKPVPPERVTGALYGPSGPPPVKVKPVDVKPTGDKPPFDLKPEPKETQLEGANPPAPSPAPKPNGRSIASTAPGFNPEQNHYKLDFNVDPGPLCDIGRSMAKYESNPVWWTLLGVVLGFAIGLVAGLTWMM